MAKKRKSKPKNEIDSLLGTAIKGTIAIGLVGATAKALKL